MRGISLIIPTYNGRHILEEFLPSVFRACAKYPGKTETIIVDDASTDATDVFLKKRFPKVRVISLPKNCGYGYACNLGVIESKFDLVVLLNNDVWVESDFLLYLPDYFDDEEIFAARVKVYRFEDRELVKSSALRIPTIWVRGEFKFGFIYVPADKTCLMQDNPKGNSAFSIGGGAFIADKKKWLKLGGFDDLFYPFYSEETDISYRALKRSWKIIYEDRSIAYHRGAAFTISKVRSHWYVKLIGERNRYFLVWKNLTDAAYILRHFLFLPFRLIRNLITGNLIPFLAFFYGLLWLPAIYKRRKKEKKESVVKDREIFGFFELTQERSSLGKGELKC